MNCTKLIRYKLDQAVAYGLVIDQRVHSLASGPWPHPEIGPAIASLDQVQLLAPCEPGKIVAVGLNYAAHAAEHGSDMPAEPLIFLKPPTTVIGPGDLIVYPIHLSQRVDHEAELAVVMGRRACRVPRDKALSFVAGYTCSNDVTARDLQKRDGQWTRAKGFDTFCPVGPWVVAGLDVSDLAIRCKVNGKLRQEARTGDMIFSVGELIAHISAVMTLEAGDLILTGTPAGVGPLLPGDRVSVEIEGIGVLENEVVNRG
jgi:2-keto-4-pentenoate hydratase/2-oxohepta-3-ene-1,7-dioic acid hydratase in catechol pathway